MKIINELLNELPNEALRYLSVIAETENDYQVFVDNFKEKHSNIYVSIAEFRIWKILNREISYLEFMEFFEYNPKIAIEKLFLFPYRKSMDYFILDSIKNEKFTKEDLYNFHIQFPIANPIFASKELLYLPKFPFFK